MLGGSESEHSNEPQVDVVDSGVRWCLSLNLAAVVAMFWFKPYLGCKGLGMPADYKRAEEEAVKLLRKFKIENPPVDPEAIAEAMGIEVVYATFNGPLGEKISGFIEPANARIVVNSDIYPNRKTFTIAHELAHHVLHRDYALSDDYRVFARMNDYENGKPDEEKEADAFAAHLLVPTAMLKKYRNIASTSELARMFCVSDAVILNRMNWLR